MVENLGGDSDEDEGKTPTISVVIDEDVPPTESNAENDQSEITSTTVEEAPSLVLEDHDYTGAKSAGRSAPGWHGSNYSESSEPFPVLEGLESYIGDALDVDHHHQQQHPHYQRPQQHYGPTSSQRRLHADQSGRVTSSAAVIHTSGGVVGGGVYPIRAGIRQLHKESGGYGGAPIPVQARPIGAGPNALPTVFNQRSGVTRTIRQSEYGSPMMRGPPAGVAYGRYATGSPAHPRALISSSTSSAASNGSYQSMLAGDPSRAANDNAPAPLIVPSRGVKPIQRSRVGIPSRMPVNVAGQSPRKFYQVTTKGSAADYDHMHSYAKAASSNADYESYAGPAQYTHERGELLAKAGGGRGAVDDQSSTFIDVVAEEEAQNAKFFQRQSDAMGGGVLAKPRTSSFNEPHDGQGPPQRATPVKHNASKEHILVVDSPQHPSQHDPLSVPQRYRSIDGSGVPQGLPQRHRLLSSQMAPGEYGANPSYAYTISPDNQDIFMSKQAQRPRGRPRGSRTISVGSHASAALSRQQPHGGRPMHTSAMYGHEMGGGVPSYVSPTSVGGTSGEVCSSSGELETGGAAEFHRHAAAGGEISSSQDHSHAHQQVPQQQKYVAPQTYMYQPQPGAGDFHRQQRPGQVTSSAAVAPELAGLSSEASAGGVPPEFSHADAQILQHQQRLERQQQQLQAAQQHHLGGQQPQYQSLEDLAELAQLSQQQQHFISAAGQRPVYAGGVASSIYTAHGELAGSNKQHQSSYSDGGGMEARQLEQHQRKEVPQSQQHANGELMQQLDGGAADAVKQQMMMHQQPISLSHHPHHNQHRVAHMSHSDGQLAAYYSLDGGYPSHTALNHHMMPNYGAPQPYPAGQVPAFGGDVVPQFQAGVYPPGHQLHGVAGHESLMMEKLKKPRKPRTPKDPEALAEKKREKKERKQKAEGEKTPRRPRKSKDAGEPTPVLSGHPLETHPPMAADTSASGLGPMVVEAPPSEKSDKKRATSQRSARKSAAATAGSVTADETANSSSSDDAEDDYGEYTTRCLCGMTHNDDFMIQCDKCDVWQHGVCMDVSAKNPPKTYFCELCNPRMLKHTKQHAASIQTRVLARIQDNKRRSKSSKNETPKSAIKNKLKFKPKQTSSGRATQEKQASPRKSLSAKDSVKPENQYSRGVRAFIVQQTDNFGDANLLKTIKGRSALARQMFVANNVEGLVALLSDPDSTIPAGSAIIEYNGLFHMAGESAAQSKGPSAKNTSSLRYCNFGEENAIIVDGSKFGSAARFARRSCKPNAVVRHVVHEGRLHLLLVSNEIIGFSQEITIPFDFDFTASPIPVSCACGSTDEQFGRENPTDCDIYKFNQALASLNSASIAELATKPAPSSASRSQSPSKAKKAKEEPVQSSENETDGNRRRSTRTAPENVESLAPESGRKTRGVIAAADAPFPAKTEAEEVPKKSSGTARDASPPKKTEEVRKTRSAAVTPKVAPNSEPRRARDVAPQKTEAVKESEQSPEPRKSQTAAKSKSVKEELKDLSPEPRKTRSVVKQETPKEQPAVALEPTSEARKTRSAIKQETDATPSSRHSRARMIFKEKETKSPNAVAATSSSMEVDKPRLSREDRKVQEAMAAFQRLEERQKQQHDKRKSTSSAAGVVEKRIKTESEMVKRSSLRLFSTSSASSSTSSVANARSSRRVTVVEPKKEANEGTPVTSKVSKRISSQHDKDGSPSKKKRLDEKQISHAEAAQLLTEMAFGIKAESEEDLNKNIHSKLRLAAEIALEHTPIKAQGNFSLDSHLTVASRDDKSAARRVRELQQLTVAKSPAPATTSTRSAKSASKESAAVSVKPEPRAERSSPKERTAVPKEVKTKVTAIFKPKEEAMPMAKETTPSSPAVERSPKRSVSESQKQKAANESVSQTSSVKLPVVVTPAFVETATAEVATAPATSSTADSSNVTTSAIIGGGEEFKLAAESPPAPSTPTTAATPILGGGSGVVLPSTIVTKSVKKLTLAEYKKRQSSSALSTPNANTRQLRSSPSKPQRGFMPSLKDVSATSSSLSSPPSGLLEPNLSPRSTMFAAIPVPSPPSAPVSSLRSPGALVVTPQAPSSSSQVGTPSIDELRRRIFGGKAKEDTAESTPRSAIVTPSSQPRMTLEERLKSQFGLGRGQPNNTDGVASRYGSSMAVPPPPPPPPVSRTMTTRARASPYDPYATSGGEPNSILVPPPPPPPSHSIHERR